MLSKAAFNALLKTLEEPNKNTVFILATTEVEKIPPTILSRCQMINFKTLSKSSLIHNLENICNKEKISIKSQLDIVEHFTVSPVGTDDIAFIRYEHLYVADNVDFIVDSGDFVVDR